MLAAPGVGAALVHADPLLLSVLVGAVVAGAGGLALVRWLRDPVDRLCGVIARRDEIVVLMHPNPDPDAIASAMAVAHLAATVDTEATVQHAGSIDYQNRSMVEQFDVDVERIEDANWLACREVVLVDHNEPRGFPGASNLDPIAVVDHHPGGGEGIEFTDVQPGYGACATLLTEYLRDRRGEAQIAAPLATALLYGIQTDTNSLTRGCSPAEFDASEYLYGYADPNLLARVATPAVPGEFLDVQARAITNRTVDEPVALSDVGDVETVEAVAGAADQLLRLEGISTVVVYGTHGETLHLSGRSSDAGVHVGDALRDAVADIPMASAGGHARMGGGQVSVPHLEGIGPGPGVSQGEFRRRLFDALGAQAGAADVTPGGG